MEIISMSLFLLKLFGYFLKSKVFYLIWVFLTRVVGLYNMCSEKLGVLNDNYH